jgi:hypothetical protein
MPLDRSMEPGVGDDAGDAAAPGQRLNLTPRRRRGQSAAPSRAYSSRC